jgi:hypothetical protein
MTAPIYVLFIPDTKEFLASYQYMVHSCSTLSLFEAHMFRTYKDAWAHRNNLGLHGEKYKVQLVNIAPTLKEIEEKRLTEENWRNFKIGDMK